MEFSRSRREPTRDVGGKGEGNTRNSKKVQACGHGMLRAFWKCIDKNYYFVQRTYAGKRKMYSKI